MEYGCIGKKLSHSFSKPIHEKAGGYDYALVELGETELEEFFRRREFRAINVTIPYKEAVIPFLDEISPVAARIGAVNTIVNENGRLKGFNTDIYGLSALLTRTGISPDGKKVVITGTGGTSKTALALAERSGAKEIVRVSRTARENAVTYEELYARHTDAEIIINTTPVGMYPELFACPVDPARFPSLTGVIDAVYNPLNTVLVRQAAALGVPSEGGLYMLVAQAVAAYGLFTGNPPGKDLTDRIFTEILKEKTNIVLTGMPGSGKTTVGRLLAGKTGRRFLDLDEELVREEKRTVAEVFAQDGEDGFRRLEEALIRRLSCVSGAVIATGGGAVLKKANTDALKMNGKIYFLDRPLSGLLPTEDRPLARTEEAVRKLYEERYGTYLASADVRVPTGNSAEETAAIIERMHENL